MTSFLDTPLVTLENNGIKCGSNPNVGGSITEYWNNGFQYINYIDMGREAQTALFWEDKNPTEGGSEGAPSTTPNLNSPLVTLENQGNTQVSACHPKEWHDAGTVYDWITLGKHITVGTEPGVSTYVTDVVLERPIEFSGLYQVEIPSIYTRPELCRYYGFDALQGIVSAFPLQNYSGGDVTQYQKQYFPDSGVGGVVVATDDFKHALGIFGSKGSSVSYYTLWNFSIAPPTNQSWLDWSCSKLTAVHVDTISPIQPGTYSYETKILTGSLDSVLNRMYMLAHH